jgi:hypothetical protein
LETMRQVGRTKKSIGNELDAGIDPVEE